MKHESESGRRVVLVIDEAQNLGVSGLEELRVLSNLNTGKELLLQSILIGQPELRTTLRLQGLRQFAQRIVIDHHLEPLQPDETVGYVLHRVGVAGGSGELFTRAAIELVHACTGGVPRLVNIVCDTALVYGFADKLDVIGAEIVEQVVQDRMSGGLLPLRATTPAVHGTLAAS